MTTEQQLINMFSNLDETSIKTLNVLKSIFDKTENEIINIIYQCKSLNNLNDDLKIHYLHLQVDNDIQFDENLEFFDDLIENDEIELDGSLDKYEGKYLSKGLLKDNMDFLFHIENDNDTIYLKCKLYESFEGEDKHWISYMYYPKDVEIISENTFIELAKQFDFETYIK